MFLQQQEEIIKIENESLAKTQQFVKKQKCNVNNQYNSKTSIQYLNQIRKSLNNLDEEMDMNLVQQVHQKQKSFKIIISCLSVLCRIVYRQNQKTKKASIKHILNQQFVSNFVQLNLKQVGNITHNLQSTVCFILQLIYQNNFFNQRQNQIILQKYKRFSIEFLSLVSKNNKTLFNILKVIEWLQNNKLFTTVDYSRNHLVQNIIQSIKKLQSDLLVIYQLVFKLLINGGCAKDAYLLYKQLNEQRKTYVVEAFFSVLNAKIDKISDSLVIQITKQHLFKQKVESGFVLDILSHGIKRMNLMQFIELIDNKLVQKSLQLWQDALKSNCIYNFKNFINSIRLKAQNTIVNQPVRDILNQNLPQIAKKLNMIRTEQYQNNNIRQ